MTIAAEHLEKLRALPDRLKAQLTGQDAAIEGRAHHFAAEQRHDAPLAHRRLAERQHGLDIAANLREVGQERRGGEVVHGEIL